MHHSNSVYLLSLKQFYVNLRHVSRLLRQLKQPLKVFMFRFIFVRTTNS